MEVATAAMVARVLGVVERVNWGLVVVVVVVVEMVVGGGGC